MQTSGTPRRVTEAACLRLRLGASRRLAVSLITAHLLTAGGVLASGLDPALCGAFLLLLGGSLAFHLRRHAWLADPRSVVAIELSDALECEAQERAGRRLTGRVLSTSFVAPWLVVINLDVGRRRLARSIVVMPDTVDRESFRALRVWLRWRRAGADER
jgi:toxin CptA